MNNQGQAKLAAHAIDPKSRHHILDALRGFALFGIFFANIQAFGGWYDITPSDKAIIVGSQIYDSFMLLLVDGRFYTLFSFLFGLGFALQLSRLNINSSENASKLYMRRLVILLLIGLTHQFIFWFGDILTLYALLGFVLFAVRQMSDKAILILAAVMMLIPIPGYLLFWAAGVDADFGLYEMSSRLMGGDGNLGTLFAGFSENNRTTEATTFFRLNTELGLARFGYYIDTWRIPKVLGVMLIGMWAGRKLVHGKLLENVRLLKMTMLVGFTVGIPASFAYMYLAGLNSFQPHSLEGFWSVIAYMLAVFPTGFAYAAVFALIWRQKSTVLQVFAAPGRMALTNYLMQTLLATLIFYGVGLGIGPAGAPGSYVVIAIAVFAMQVVLSNLWLKSFRYGPIEWVWRSLTYGQWIRVRRMDV